MAETNATLPPFILAGRYFAMRGNEFPSRSGANAGVKAAMGWRDRVMVSDYFTNRTHNN
jgi:hypothetical protein